MGFVRVMHRDKSWYCIAFVYRAKLGEWGFCTRNAKKNGLCWQHQRKKEKMK